MTVTGVPISSLPNGVIFSLVQVEARGQLVNTVEPADGVTVFVYVHVPGVTPGPESTQVQVFADEALTLPLAQPLTTDGNGNVPGFVAFGQAIDLLASGGRLAVPQVLYVNSGLSGALGGTLAGDASGSVGATTVNTVKGGKVPLSTDQLGTANGPAGLDGAGKLPAAQLTVDAMEYKGAWNASTNTPTLANGTGSPGDYYAVSVGGSAGPVTAATGDHVILNPSLVWEDIPIGGAGGVTTFNTRTGPVTLTKADVTGTGLAAADVGAAPLASPALTGTPTAPTATPLDSSTKLGTTAYADAAVLVEKTRALTAEGTNATAIATEATNRGTADALLLAKSDNLASVADTGSSRLNLKVPTLTPCAVVATSNVAALTGLLTIDGYTLVAGDHVLLTGQTTGSQNGPWIAASGAWARPTSYPPSAAVTARSVEIIQGTVGGGGRWLLQTNASITVDTTATTWVLQTSKSVVTDSSGTGANHDIPMNGHLITGMNDPANPQDAATKNYVDAHGSNVTGVQQLAVSGGINELLRRRPTADRWVTQRVFATKFVVEATKTISSEAAGTWTTSAAHGYLVGDVVEFPTLVTGTGFTVGVPYYVTTTPSTTTFTLSATLGGATLVPGVDYTGGTVARIPDGHLWAYTNMAYTTSSARPALRAADGGTVTFASIFTAKNDLRDWDIRVRYRPANGTATGDTTYGPNPWGGFTDSNNGWSALQYHGAGNQNIQAGAIVAGTYSQGPAIQTDVNARSTTQDRVIRIRKTGDLLQVKDWPTNQLEPGWQQERRYRPPLDSVSTFTSIDNPESGQCGIYSQFSGAYVLDLTVAELRRESENAFHNADFTRIDINPTADVPFVASVNLATGVVTTNTYLGAAANHGYAVGDQVVFGGFSVPGGVNDPGVGALWPLLDYYVASVPTSSTLTVSRTRGGSAITSFTNASLPALGVYCTRRPLPAYWYAPLNSALLSGNKLERVCIAGPDGSVRPALSMIVTTPNDPILGWTTHLWSPFNQAGDGADITRMQPHPQWSPNAKRLELSYWTKGSQANVGTDLGITFDCYIYDAYGQTIMRRNAYHPTLGPGIAADATDPASYDSAAIASTWGWTYLTSIMELDAVDAVHQMRAQILLHGTTTTGTVYIMDPFLRPIG